MEQRWVGLNTNGWNDLIVGLLKENQLAIAVEKLQEMRSLDIFILEWIPPAVIHCLIANGEYAEAVRLLEQQTEDERETGQLNTWNLLLQAASQDHDHEVVSTVWRRAVKPEYLNPSSGICEDVLNTAAGVGDLDLASKVFRTLAERKDAAALEVCEPMLETYIQSNRLSEAIELLCAMNDNGLVPSEAALRPVVESCIRNSSIVNEDLLQTLRELTANDVSVKQTVPIELVNAIMEINLRSSEARQAKTLFDDRTSVCLTPPNMRTFRLLFHACRQLRDLDSALAYYVGFRSAMPEQRQDESIFIDLVDTTIATDEFSKATDFIIAAQDDSVSIVSSTINHWMDCVNEQARPHTRYLAQFVDKLEHMVRGEEIRKEIEVLTHASEEINPFIAVREAEEKVREAYKAQQASVVSALDQWFKKEGEGHIKERKERIRQERIAKDFLHEEVGKMLDNAASFGQRHLGSDLASLGRRRSKHPSASKLFGISTRPGHTMWRPVNLRDGFGSQSQSPHRPVVWKHIDMRDETEFESRVGAGNPTKTGSYVETEAPSDVNDTADLEDSVEFAELGKEEAQTRTEPDHRFSEETTRHANDRLSNDAWGAMLSSMTESEADRPHPIQMRDTVTVKTPAEGVEPAKRKGPDEREAQAMTDPERALTSRPLIGGLDALEFSTGVEEGRLSRFKHPSMFEEQEGAAQAATEQERSSPKESSNTASSRPLIGGLDALLASMTEPKGKGKRSSESPGTRRNKASGDSAKGEYPLSPDGQERKESQAIADRMVTSPKESGAASGARPSIGGLDDLLSSMKETEKKGRRRK